MIVADDVVPEELCDSRQRVAEHGLRMCPMCIGLATFGDPKSITMRFGESASATPRRSSRSNAAACSSIASRRNVKLMNPAPAICGASQS